MKFEKLKYSNILVLKYYYLFVLKYGRKYSSKCESYHKLKVPIHYMLVFAAIPRLMLVLSVIGNDKMILIE